MSKRRYNSVEFKRVDWQQVQERITGPRVVFAVDVAKEKFVATLLDDEQQALVTFKWIHPCESAEVIERISALEQSRRVEAVMEPSGTYGDALGWLLREAGIPLYRVAPKRVHDAAEVYDGVPSLHDAKAAYLIGRLHLQGVSQRWPAPSEQRRELMALLARLELLKERQQAGLNRLEAHLSRHWPESLSLMRLSAVSLHALIAQYGDAQSVRADPEGAAALLRRIGHAGLSVEKIRALLASAEHSIGVPCLEAERVLLQWLATDINQTHKQLREVEHALEQRVEHTPVLSDMGEVLGKVSAAVLSAAVGSPQSYPDTASYLKAMGLNLKERSSGKHQGQLKITKRGPSVARFYLYFAALRLIAHNSTVQRWFALKTHRPGALKNKTVIELMRKLAKALWHVARGERFAPEKLFNLRAVAEAAA
jgi:transposase